MKITLNREGKEIEMRLRNKKTGEHGNYKVISAGNLIRVRDLSSDESWQYDCIADFNDKWEDYEPVEPEIADQTARETIRKWYNKNRIVGKLYSYGGESWLGLRGDDKSGCSWKIELHVDYFSKLISDKLYSLNELCGENEDSEHELDSEEKKANEY